MEKRSIFFRVEFYTVRGRSDDDDACEYNQTFQTLCHRPAVVEF